MEGDADFVVELLNRIQMLEQAVRYLVSAVVTLVPLVFLDPPVSAPLSCTFHPQVQEKDQLLSTQSVKVKDLENQVVQCASCFFLFLFPPLVFFFCFSV